MLTPSVFEELITEDWDHLVYGEEIGNCFDSLPYLLRRVAAFFDNKRHQILAVTREPSEVDLLDFELPNFLFMGFELIDDGLISALANCGGFEGAFNSSDLSSSGLVVSPARAYEIRKSLANLYPDEPHAHCNVWGIWRYGTAQPAH
jgi:hypothetical protein